MRGLAVKGIGGVLLVVIGMGLLLFLPAGTLDFWQAWVFLALFGGAGLAIVVYFAWRDPQLLARRLSAGPTAEQRTSERILMSIMSLGFMGILVVPGLDHRFGWSSVPVPVVVAADVVFVVGWIVIFLVFRENTFTSATIEVAEDHRVVSTGPYSIVRHPMYSGSLLYIAAIPIALGSWWGLVVFALMVPFGAWRIFDEESLLRKSLPGYAEYTERVRHRLIPMVW